MEEKQPYYRQQIERLHESVKSGDVPFFLNEAAVAKDGEIKKSGNYIEEGQKITLFPRPAVRTAKGNLLKGINQLTAQAELHNMGSKAQTVLTFEEASRAGTFIKKGSKSILLTGYDEKEKKSKVYRMFSAGSLDHPQAIQEALIKNKEANKSKPWTRDISCHDSSPEKFLGAYLAASASGADLHTDRKTVEDFQKSFESLIAKSIEEKNHVAVFAVGRAAQIVKCEILKENFKEWEKIQKEQKSPPAKQQSAAIEF